MSRINGSWRYWSLDLPGLDRSSAQELLRAAEGGGMSDAGSLVDPEQFLTVHLDRLTVSAVYTALSQIRLAADGVNRSDGTVVNGFRELLGEWLEETSE